MLRHGFLERHGRRRPIPIRFLSDIVGESQATAWDLVLKVVIYGVQRVRLEFREDISQAKFNSVDSLEKGRPVNFDAVAAKSPFGSRYEMPLEYLVFFAAQMSAANYTKIGHIFFSFSAIVSVSVHAAGKLDRDGSNHSVREQRALPELA
jgi:hypothetical protein